MKKAIATLISVFATTSLAVEKVVPYASLPKAVQAAIHNKYPSAKISKAEQETEAGKTSYEVALTDKGTKMDVALTADGEIVAVEKKISTNDVPKGVADGLQAKYPRSSLAAAEEITRSGKVSYELKITTAEKKRIEVTFDDAGNFIAEEAL